MYSEVEHMQAKVNSSKNKELTKKEEVLSTLDSYLRRMQKTTNKKSPSSSFSPFIVICPVSFHKKDKN
jgi:hypothetical protein